MSDAPQYLTIDQLAAHAGRHPETLRRLALRGLLPAEKTPGVKGYRITVAKANRFLARHWPGTPDIKFEDYARWKESQISRP